jgi:hypothetical protein
MPTYRWKQWTHLLTNDRQRLQLPLAPDTDMKAIAVSGVHRHDYTRTQDNRDHPSTVRKIGWHTQTRLDPSSSHLSFDGVAMVGGGCPLTREHSFCMLRCGSDDNTPAPRSEVTIAMYGFLETTAGSGSLFLTTPCGSRPGRPHIRLRARAGVSL